MLDLAAALPRTCERVQRDLAQPSGQRVLRSSVRASPPRVAARGLGVAVRLRAN